LIGWGEVKRGREQYFNITCLGELETMDLPNEFRDAVPACPPSGKGTSITCIPEMDLTPTQTPFPLSPWAHGCPLDISLGVIVALKMDPELFWMWIVKANYVPY